MSAVSRFLIFALLVMLLGTGIFLVTWEIPPPRVEVEHVLDDARFPR